MEITPEWLVAMATFVTAITGAYVSLRRRLSGIHDLVNSQLETVMTRLDVALAERDEARDQRDG